MGRGGKITYTPTDESKKNLHAEARVFYEVEADYPRLQEWVCRELTSKGYVEVDDKWPSGKPRRKRWSTSCRRRLMS